MGLDGAVQQLGAVAVGDHGVLHGPLDADELRGTPEPIDRVGDTFR